MAAGKTRKSKGARASTPKPIANLPLAGVLLGTHSRYSEYSAITWSTLTSHEVLQYHYTSNTKTYGSLKTEVCQKTTPITSNHHGDTHLAAKWGHLRGLARLTAHSTASVATERPMKVNHQCQRTTHHNPNTDTPPMSLIEGRK